MNCGNCGKGNEYGAEICAHCGSTLALTEYYRRKGFVVKKDPPKKSKDEPWDQEILTTGYHSKHRKPKEEETPSQDTRPRGRNTSGGKTTGKTDDRGQTVTGAGTSSRRKNTATQTATATRTTATSRKDTPNRTSTPSRKETATRADTSTRGTRPSGGKATSSDTKKSAQEGKSKPKKIPKSKAYNHTTKTLSMAEKEVQKKTGKKSSGGSGHKWLITLAIIVVISIVAVGIFIGTMNFGGGEDRYTEGAQAFVKALVMDDEATLEKYVHPKMHGYLTPLGYKNVTRCDTKVVEFQEIDGEELRQDLGGRFELTEPITEVYRVHVGCTVYGEGTYACAMDVIMAEISGNVYAVGAENIADAGGN